MVEKQGERLTVLIPEFAYCCKSRFNGNLRINDEVALEYNSADPVELKVSLQIRKIQESSPNPGL